MTTVAEESVRGLMRLTTVPDKLIQGTDGPLSWELRRAQKHPLRGMLSLEEIRNWGDSVAAESTFKLIKFCHKPAKPAGRAVTQIVFGERRQRIPSLDFPRIHHLLAGFQKGVQADIFRGPGHATRLLRLLRALTATVATSQRTDANG
jgi:hypothetical protein